MKGINLLSWLQRVNTAVGAAPKLSALKLTAAWWAVPLCQQFQVANWRSLSIYGSLECDGYLMSVICSQVSLFEGFFFFDGHNEFNLTARKLVIVLLVVVAFDTFGRKSKKKKRWKMLEYFFFSGLLNVQPVKKSGTWSSAFYIPAKLLDK